MLDAVNRVEEAPSAEALHRQLQHRKNPGLRWNLRLPLALPRNLPNRQTRRNSRRSSRQATRLHLGSSRADQGKGSNTTMGW
jgi:hypothetical protein